MGLSNLPLKLKSNLKTNPLQLYKISSLKTNLLLPVLLNKTNPQSNLLLPVLLNKKTNQSNLLLPVLLNYKQNLLSNFLPLLMKSFILPLNLVALVSSRIYHPSGRVKARRHNLGLGLQMH
jgi:hypothetical protein